MLDLSAKTRCRTDVCIREEMVLDLSGHDVGQTSANVACIWEETVLDLSPRTRCGRDICMHACREHIMFGELGTRKQTRTVNDDRRR